MFTPQALLAEWSGRRGAERDARVARFLAPANAPRRYAMGRNAQSLALGAHIDLAGYVDDYAPPGSEWGGRPVVGSRDLPADSLVAHCVFSQRPRTAWESLNAAAVETLRYADLLRTDAAPLPDFVADMRADAAENMARWSDLHAALADEASKRTLADIAGFRMTGDFDFMRAYSWNVTEQYFDAVAQPAPGAVFIDAGGYDGDTTQAYCDRFPDYGRAHVFEPSPANMARAQKRLAAYRDIVFHTRGLGAEPGVARFDPGSGSSSALSSEGAMELEITTIDGAVTDPAGFIKLDIEGEELNALRGAANQIAANGPIIAAAVYHRASDFWAIPEFVQSLRGDFKLYLRHYTEGWAESVMYFVRG